MFRVLAGALVGAVVSFVFNFVSWQVLELHNKSFNRIPDESELTEKLVERGMRASVYLVPPPPIPIGDPQGDEVQKNADAREQFGERLRQGPIYTVFYQPDGRELMSPQTLGRGFGIEFFCGLCLAIVLRLTAPSCQRYLGRVGVVMMIALFAAAASHVALWNWMGFPREWTIAMARDIVIGWTLAGFLMAAIIKAPPPVPAPAPAAK
jgi:hypothetical protein